jgi:hypothetical protein
MGVTAPLFLKETVRLIVLQAATRRRCTVAEPERPVTRVSKRGKWGPLCSENDPKTTVSPVCSGVATSVTREHSGV